MEELAAVCDSAGVTLVDATFRWLIHHSCLSAGDGDGILLGASSVAHLEQNLGACTSAALLPEPVIAAFEAAWHGLREAGPFPYWRSYSADHPNRESLPPGAGYVVLKPK